MVKLQNTPKNCYFPFIRLESTCASQPTQLQNQGVYIFAGKSIYYIHS